MGSPQQHQQHQQQRGGQGRPIDFSPLDEESSAVEMEEVEEVEEEGEEGVEEGAASAGVGGGEQSRRWGSPPDIPHVRMRLRPQPLPFQSCADMSRTLGGPASASPGAASASVHNRGGVGAPLRRARTQGLEVRRSVTDSGAAQAGLSGAAAAREAAEASRARARALVRAPAPAPMFLQPAGGWVWGMGAGGCVPLDGGREMCRAAQDDSQGMPEGLRA